MHLYVHVGVQDTRLCLPDVSACTSLQHHEAGRRVPLAGESEEDLRLKKRFFSLQSEGAATQICPSIEGAFVLVEILCVPGKISER